MSMIWFGCKVRLHCIWFEITLHLIWWSHCIWFSRRVSPGDLCSPLSCRRQGFTFHSSHCVCWQIIWATIWLRVCIQDLATFQVLSLFTANLCTCSITGRCFSRLGRFETCKIMTWSCACHMIWFWPMSWDLAGTIFNLPTCVSQSVVQTLTLLSVALFRFWANTFTFFETHCKGSFTWCSDSISICDFEYYLICLCQLVFLCEVHYHLECICHGWSRTGDCTLVKQCCTNPMQCLLNLLLLSMKLGRRPLCCSKVAKAGLYIWMTLRVFPLIVSKIVSRSPCKALTHGHGCSRLGYSPSREPFHSAFFLQFCLVLNA